MPGSFGTVSSQPVGSPTLTERFASWRFDGDDGTGLQETDLTDSLGRISVTPTGPEPDIGIDFAGKGAGPVSIRGVPTLALADAGVVSVDFTMGETVSTLQALAGRPIMLTLAGRPDATGMFWWTNVVDGVSFDIVGDVALGTVSVSWAIIALS